MTECLDIELFADFGTMQWIKLYVVQYAALGLHFEMYCNKYTQSKSVLILKATNVTFEHDAVSKLTCKIEKNGLAYKKIGTYW